MLILALDTSGQLGSMALARGANEPFSVLEQVSLAGRTYSARLIPELSSLLTRRHLQIQDLEAFAVVSGPGSFTGLRVGLSSVKALAEVLKRPITAISMLQAIAAQSGAKGRILAAFDAGRKEVYAGEYDLAGAEPKLVGESLLTRAEFLSLLAAGTAAELVTPDPALSDLASGRLRVKQVQWPGAGEIARLGLTRISTGQTVAVETLDANYIRRSDAEIFSSPR